MKLIFLPDGSSRVVEFKISKLHIFLTFPVAILSLIVGVAFATNFLSDSVYSLRLRQLAQDRADLTSQLEQLHSKSKDIDQSIKDLFVKDDDLRNFADLPHIPETFRDVGVGGSASQPLQTSSYFELEAKTTFELVNDLEKFERLLDLEVESYKEITDKLQLQKELARHYPSTRPVEVGRKVDDFGWRKDPFDGSPDFHSGIDIGAETGTPVKATADGTINFAGSFYSYGNLVQIDHNSREFGFQTKYGHLEKILVKNGQKVKRGDVIGTVGRTGRVTGRHLHYEVLVAGQAVDPLEYYLDPLELQ